MSLNFRRYIEAGVGQLANYLQARAHANQYNKAQEHLLDKTNKANRELAEYAFEKNYFMWQEQNRYNSPSAQMSRLREAGLNPNLIYGTGAKTGIASQMPAYKAPPQDYRYQKKIPIAELLQYQQVQSALQLNQAQIKDTKASIDVKKAQVGDIQASKELKQANTKLVDGNRDNQIAQTLSQTQKIDSATSLNEANIRLKEVEILSSQLSYDIRKIAKEIGEHPEQLKIDKLKNDKLLQEANLVVKKIEEFRKKNGIDSAGTLIKSISHSLESKEDQGIFKYILYGMKGLEWAVDLFK